MQACITYRVSLEPEPAVDGLSRPIYNPEYNQYQLVTSRTSLSIYAVCSSIKAQWHTSIKDTNKVHR
jgi:hypothetical protein